MTTDGGGFILIGRKDNPMTYTFPSNDDPVEPFGKPHWTSSLGDAPILDFRVQMATSDDFKATKAHWYLSHNYLPLYLNIIVMKTVRR